MLSNISANTGKLELQILNIMKMIKKILKDSVFTCYDGFLLSDLLHCDEHSRAIVVIEYQGKYVTKRMEEAIFDDGIQFRY